MNEDEPYINIGLNDETARVVYPIEDERVTRVGLNNCNFDGFELSEIERLSSELARAQGRLEVIRAEWELVHLTCPVPVFVRDWFNGLRLLIEGEK